MKKSTRKLRLAKNTLRNLDRGLGGVRGGGDVRTVIEDILGEPPKYTEQAGCTEFCGR